MTNMKPPRTLIALLDNTLGSTGRTVRAIALLLALSVATCLAPDIGSALVRMVLLR